MRGEKERHQHQAFGQSDARPNQLSQPPRSPGELAIRYRCNNTIMASLSKSKKNSKSVNTATATSSNKSLKGNGQASICSICCDVMVDATAGEDGHDSIFCDGACNGWLHRRCAGLPKAAFQAICDATTANQPFYCPHCRLDSQEKAITTLKQAIDLLSQETARLKRIVCQPDTASTTVQLSPATVTAPHIPPPQPQTSQLNLPRATQIAPPMSLGNSTW